MLRVPGFVVFEGISRIIRHFLEKYLKKISFDLKKKQWVNVYFGKESILR